MVNGILEVGQPSKLQRSSKCRTSGILNCSWCSSRVSTAGFPDPKGHTTVLDFHMLKFWHGRKKKVKQDPPAQGKKQGEIHL
jgi:hypothetical protein